jgi:hypothetical protein
LAEAGRGDLRCRGCGWAAAGALLLGGLIASSSAAAAETDAALSAAFATGAGGDASLRLDPARSGRTTVLAASSVSGGADRLSLVCALCSRDELLAESRALGAVLAAARSGARPCLVEIAGLPPGAEVRIDGLPARAGGRSQPVEPGRHVVRAVGPGGPRTERLDLEIGESSLVAWDAMKAETPKPRPLRVALAASGLGLALAAAGTAFLLLDGHCATTRVDAAGRCEEIQSLAPLGWSFVGAGAAAVLFGVIYGVVAERSGRPDEAGEEAVP